MDAMQELLRATASKESPHGPGGGHTDTADLTYFSRLCSQGYFMILLEFIIQSMIEFLVPLMYWNLSLSSSE